MAEPNRNTVAGRYASVDTIDEGLRVFMLRVYNYMAAGLAITGLAAFAIFQFSIPAEGIAPAVLLKNGVALNQFGALLFTSMLRYVVIFAPLITLFVVMARLERMSVQGAQLGFWVFSALMGISLSSIFLVYSGESITRVFFFTAAAFGALSLYGYTTHRNLSAMQSFLVMGLFGVVIASVVNVFIGSSTVQFITSIIGVLVFSGLTAMDTQQIKESYFEGDGETVAGKKAVWGALKLYLDFVNMFMMLLHLFGGNRE